jgi:hypothetical protein
MVKNTEGVFPLGVRGKKTSRKQTLRDIASKKQQDIKTREKNLRIDLFYE